MGLQLQGSRARLVAGHPVAAVELDLAASDQEIAELDAGALHPRLHPRWREPEPGRRLGLRQPSQLGEHERLAGMRWEPLQEWRQARCELASQLGRGGLGGRRLMAADVDARRPFSLDGRAPVVIGDRVAGDPKDPRAQRRCVLDVAGVAVDPQQDLLQDVLGGVVVRGTPSYEGEQRSSQLIPRRDRVGPLGGARRAHRQPHSSGLPAPQQSAFASAAQQASCSAGAQQALSMAASRPAKNRARFSGSS